jgi:hypothetical protein
MLTVNRRPGPPIDCRTAVIVDLPHAADRPAAAYLCSLMTADTHEPVTGVLGMSLHFDCNRSPGNYAIWAVAEQFIDENDQPLPPGTQFSPDYHPEYFNGTLRTGLFRYEVAGFTTGPTMNRAATWHPSLGNADDNDAADARTRVFKVSFTDRSSSALICAGHFQYSDGFVTFLGTPGAPMDQVAAFPSERVAGVHTVPGKTLLVLDTEQLRTLRSAVLWDLERIAADPKTSAYRAPLHDLAVDVLGVLPPVSAQATAHAPDAAGDDQADSDETVASFEHLGDCADVEHPAGFEPPDERNERTRSAASRLGNLVQRT